MVLTEIAEKISGRRLFKDGLPRSTKISIKMPICFNCGSRLTTRSGVGSASNPEKLQYRCPSTIECHPKHFDRNHQMYAH